jgi:hypothetical membrane protein
MRLYLVRQAIVLPLGAMLVAILIAFTVPGYSSISQHISEFALLVHPIAAVQRISAIVTGVSVLVFGVGLVMLAPRAFRFTSVAAALFAISMMSNGIFTMRTPLHGLYGLGLFMALVPAFFAVEFPWREGRTALSTLSMAAALFNMSYEWLIVSGFDPPGFRGLTQRVATIVIFGWYSVAALAVGRAHAASCRSELTAGAGGPGGR